MQTKPALTAQEELLLPTELVLAEALLSPLAIARTRRAGRIELEGRSEGKALLEVGGVAIAEGRVIRKGGRHFFKLGRLLERPANERAGGR